MLKVGSSYYADTLRLPRNSAPFSYAKERSDPYSDVRWGEITYLYNDQFEHDLIDFHFEKVRTGYPIRSNLDQKDLIPLGSIDGEHVFWVVDIVPDSELEA